MFTRTKPKTQETIQAAPQDQKEDNHRTITDQSKLGPGSQQHDHFNKRHNNRQPRDPKDRTEGGYVKR